MNKTWRALRYFRFDAGLLLGAATLLVLGVGAALLKPWPLALLVDSVLGNKPLPPWLRHWDTSRGNLILLLAVATFVLHVAQGALSAGQNYLTIRAGLRGLRRVRIELFSRLQRLSLRFFQGAKAGDLIYRASWDTYSFQTLFQQGLAAFVTAVLSLVLMVVVMWRLDPALTGVSLVVVPALVLSIRVFGKRMRERGIAAQKADSEVTSSVQRIITALPLVQSYVREDHEERTFLGETRVAQEKRRAQHGWELIYWLAIATVFGAGTAAMIWLGAHRVLEQKLTVGELLVFVAYLAQLYEPLNQLSHVGATISTASAGTERVFEILDSQDEVSSGYRPVKLASEAGNGDHPLLMKGEISFDKVAFGYDPSQPVFTELDLRLPAGSSAAIIGPSGAGKTTLLNLVPRFFDPTAGAVRLDGVDLRELRLQDLRSQIALVLQEPILLAATVAENIAYGKPEAPFREIEEAARQANAEEFIRRLPHKYETVIGEGAAHLSVGERQRISLARAFLKNAPILLLDEPTSALDSESEALILASLLDLMRGRTTLMVAHRLSTIQHVDKVVVLEGGRLVQEGLPDDLVKADGYYSRLVSAQEHLRARRAS